MEVVQVLETQLHFSHPLAVWCGWLKCSVII